MQPPEMSKVAAATLLLSAAAIAVLLFDSIVTLTPSKPFYHSLFISHCFTQTSNSTAAHHLHALTRRPHVAGTPANADAARYVLSSLEAAGVGAHITSYGVLLTYPVYRSLRLSLPPPEEAVDFVLRQEVYDGDPYADVAGEVLPSFHGYARSGTATGPVVYANYGRVEDYNELQSLAINLTGTIILARYGQIYRGDIVQNAYDAGAIGVLIFSDRKDYGGASSGRWFPDEKWLPPSGVQVGSVYNGAGDPTTPGWASKEDCERLSDEEVDKGGDVPLIPSLPLSGADGEAIMRSLGGVVANGDWQGSEDGPVYRVGPGPGVINLTYIGENKIANIENVIGIIEGSEEPDRYVILGNHRDAWTFGAVDPNSGTAALLEIAERLGKLQKRGWKPRRTIVLCNWDAEEYGLVGSTEWVEDNREILASRAVAYLNVDCAVSGAGFHAASTPQLDELLKEAAKQVQDPDNSSQTIYDSWISSGDSPLIERLGGGGSDYAAFVQHVGVPSADLSFGAGYSVYHSMYDDYVWMEKFGDPMFHTHVAVASLWGLVALRLADDEFLPFNYSSYASVLKKSANELEEEISNQRMNIGPLFESIKELEKAAIQIDIEKKVIKELKWSFLARKEKYRGKVRELNDRLMMAERALTDRDGLTTRSWYKHLIYGPAKHNDYGSKSFPGVDDAINEAKEVNTTESWSSVQHEIWRVARVIKHGAQVLRGQLT